MGAEKEVKVLLEPRQKGIQHRRQGLSREGGPMEAVGAARNRAQAKRRKACEPWVSQPQVAKPEICRSAACIGDGFVRISAFLPRESCRPPGVTPVAAEDERTRR